MPGRRSRSGCSGAIGQRLAATAAACEAKGASVSVAAIDVADAAAMAAWLGGFDRDHPVDLLIANAGTSAGPDPDSPSEGAETAARQIAVNLLGAINTIEPLLPALCARGRGRIAVIASIAAYRGLPYSPGYCASKAGLRAYAEALRPRLAPRGVGVTVVCPGFFDSPMTDRFDGPTPFLRERRATPPGSSSAASTAAAAESAFPWPLVLGMQFCDLAPAIIGDAILRRFRFRIRSGSERGDRAALLQLPPAARWRSLAWLIPRACRGRPHARLAGAAARFLAGAARRRAAADRHRPAAVLRGSSLLSLGAGFALADRTKREALREPVVFSEMSELPHVFTHPHLYLPFAGPGLVIGGARRRSRLGVALLVVEPPLWRAASVAVRAASLRRSPRLAGCCRASRSLGLPRRRAAPARSRPASRSRDAAKLGPFAHPAGLRHHRPRRARRRAAPGMRRAPAPARRAARRPRRSRSSSCSANRSSMRAGCRRWCRGICCRASTPAARRRRSFGRLDVPGWGANTMRAEFAVLTGIPERDLGYDRFNPYHAFARAPIASLVWRLRGEGYRTICLHPFDRGFFRRDLAMPALGFETFLGRESLGGSRRPPYCSDPELAAPGAATCSTARGRASSSSRSRWAITARGSKPGRRSIPSCCGDSTRRACRRAASCCAISTGCAARTRCSRS